MPNASSGPAGKPFHGTSRCAMRTQLPQLVDQLVNNYRQHADIDHLEGTELPSRDAVVQVIELCRQVLFPGYFGKQDLCHTTAPYMAGQTLDALYVLLSAQIARALLHALPPQEQDASLLQEDIGPQAETLARAFLAELPAIRSLLRDDVEAAYDGDPAARGFDEIILSYPGFDAVTVYRLAHQLFTQNVPLIPRMMTEYVHGRTGIDIHPGATIGRRFFIDHGTGVVIGETTHIGDSVKLYQGVTLGALSFPKDEKGQLIRDQKRHPTLEDQVVIYANATILGGETVLGAGSVIGGGVWLTRSVPPGTKVLIAEPQLIVKTREGGTT